ncbi:uncharacterized protein LOC115763639 isoform X3 [Drosophila novamexicana]|uniref:uncharacterized protein LOC115763639 isoform X3 n=1 Tax=Drosophila novamexicana TaxID=47314 RepID=UPI0011E5A8CB|nr:uncharacterized protein LOC115763639 isoform X3 [Drosophila novamexicana]
MPKISEDTMRELDDILNESNPDANRLTAFLKLKTAPKPKATPQYVLGGYDVSFDVDVDLIKLPEKQQQQQVQSKENAQHLVTESQPQPEFPNSPTRENLPPQRRSHSVSPAHTLRFQATRSEGALPEPDKLRRVALNRRSQLGGRRELQQEFDNAVNETRKTSGTFDFLPTVSSTPASEKPATRQSPQQQKDPQQSPQQSSQRKPQRLPQRSPVAAAIGAALEPPPQHDHFEISFESSLKQMDRKAERPSKITAARRPSTSTAQRLGTPTSVGNRGIEIIETEPAPSSKSPTMGQLAAKTAPSPARTDSYVVRQPRVRLRRSPQLQKAIRIAQQSDQIVTETQTQENRSQVESLPQAPRVRLRRTSELLESTRTSQQVEPDTEHIVPETQPKETSAAPATPPRSSEAAAVSCGIQTTCSPDNIRDDTMLDESDAENTDSTAPLNLAPPGGNTTRLQRRRRQSSCQEPTMQLLDLHRTRTNHLPKQSTQKTAQVALNKPPRPAINGEQFAEELARMSNFEILDLRKRNSLGKIYPQNGEQQQQPSIMEQQLALEQSIQMEILRRNLSGQGEGLPNKVTTPSLELNALPPPAASSTGLNKSAAMGRSLSMQQFNTSSLLMELPRRSRSRRRGAPVTTELLNYLELSQAIEKRLRSRSRTDTKRSLYTKGNSDIEDNLSPLPAKQPKRLSDSSLQIAPVPSPHSIIEDIPIVPPPSISIRYSRQSRRSVRFSSIDVNEEPPEENQVQLEVNAAPDQTQTSPVEIVEEILIVPSPPAPLRYSRQSRSSGRFSSIDVNEEPPKETQVLQGAGAVEEILIVPSPPASLRYSRQSQRYLPEPPEEFMCSEAEVQQSPDAATELEDVPIRPPSPAAKRCSRRSVRLNSIAVDAELRGELNYAEEEQAEQLTGSSQPKVIEDIQIVPPAPAAIRYTRQSRRSLPQPSQEEQEQQQEQVEQGTDAQGAAAEEENLVLPAQLINNTEASSTCMEELHMETPTPPAVPEASHLDPIPLDEQPSTSRAARDALQLSIRQEESQKRNESKDTRKQQKPKKQKKPPEDDALFKKPSAPPSRKNRKNPLDSALDKLRITLVNETLPEDANATNGNDETTGVRRSKRGQVPLRNTWVHTVSNPFKFTFFERSLSTFPKFAKDKSKTRSAQNRTNSLIVRPPLCSSTPRDDREPGATESSSGTLKRKRHQLQEPLDAGISRLPEITEEEDQQMEPERLDVRQGKRKAATKTRARQKKNSRIYSDSDSETESEADPMPRTEKFYAANEPEPEPRAAPDLPPVPILNVAQNQLLQMTDWLRGVSDAAPESTEDVASIASEEENNSMRFTSAANLEFSNLDGVEYSFYGTEDKCALGYMRFQPLQQRGMKRNKTNTLRFLALYGEFEVELDNGSAEMQRCILKTGDLVEIKMGSRFNITNRLNEISLLIVNRK